MQLTDPPTLVEPTERVRDSFLAAKRADAAQRRLPVDWIDRAEADFATYVDEARGVRRRWGVPSTVYWYVSGDEYLGSLVIRHELTPDLAEAGGHIGYDIAPRWRRQGHGTRMLREALTRCRALGLDRVLITCAVDNEASRRVILANGGVPDGRARGEDRFWITVP
jgi:predicted acetyltransferase